MGTGFEVPAFLPHTARLELDKNHSASKKNPAVRTMGADLVLMKITSAFVTQQMVRWDFHQLLEQVTDKRNN